MKKLMVVAVLLAACVKDLQGPDKIHFDGGDISFALIGVTSDSAAVSVRWKASADPSGILRYEWKDTTIAPVPCCARVDATTFLTDTFSVVRPPLNGRITHEFKVRAVDVQGNVGLYSTAVRWAITRPDRIGPNPPDSVFVDSLIETSDIVAIGVWPEQVSVQTGKQVQFYTGFLYSNNTGACNIAGVSRDPNVQYNYAQWPGACDSAVRVAWRKYRLQQSAWDMIQRLALR